VEEGAPPPSVMPTHREFSVALDTVVTVNLVPGSAQWWWCTVVVVHSGGGKCGMKNQ
jgi:hypothetical protein